MDLQLAELLVELDQCELTLDPTYSGRAMYGQETAAIIHDHDSQYLLSVVLEAVNDGSLTEDDLEDIKLAGFRSDSMGLGMVIY